MGGFTQWAGRQKGGDGSRAPRPGSRGGGSSLVRALRHGEFGFRGRFERGGYISHADLKTLRLDRSAKKTRFSQPGYLRALQGHSTDCGHDLSYMAAALSSGLLPGGGPGGRLANHFVVGPMPSQWSEARGFRRGSSRPVH